MPVSVFDDLVKHCRPIAAYENHDERINWLECSNDDHKATSSWFQWCGKGWLSGAHDYWSVITAYAQASCTHAVNALACKFMTGHADMHSRPARREASTSRSVTERLKWEWKWRTEARKCPHTNWPWKHWLACQTHVINLTAEIYQSGLHYKAREFNTVVCSLYP